MHQLMAFVCSQCLQCARQGFALGLTILVGAITSIRVDALLKLIVDLLEVSSSMKGQVGKSFLMFSVGFAR